MADKSKIEWTDATWNPVTGCTKISAGCDHCYAERLALRLQKMGSKRYRNGFAVTLHPDALELPLRWRDPRRIFVNSMSDLFHGSVPTSFIDSVFDVMERASWHQFQVLTKRPGRMATYVAGTVIGRNGEIMTTPRYPGRRVPDNVWLGTSVEDERVIGRVEHLRRIPAPVRFLSCEPLIGPLRGLDLTGIDWVIVGGESGPGHRPIEKSWIREIRRACRASNTAFFFKQWGGPMSKSGGRTLDGRTYNAMPRPRLTRATRVARVRVAS
ncbi:MAG TPA: phage Gp37/Gp68 family protein [Candidatus Limnocylindria bacterium]|nr:phage Gp37/Gp68 family protein [Candidatus Limnocylindria bacterium]